MSPSRKADAPSDDAVSQKYPIFWISRGGPWGLSLAAAIVTAVAAGQPARADALQDYAQQCDAAIGVTVPDFDCDAGTEVPGQGSVFSGPARTVTCDEPNRLNRQCDPGSRFQVLVRSNDAFVVAHCRHEGGDPGMYGDIAVIQYSRKNGATCFYQALGDQNHGNMPGGHTAPNAPAKPVKAPSNGQTPKTLWLSPSATVHADHCGGCHDNGPFIRSPYLNQIKSPDPNALPGSDDFAFNKDQPYGLVGQDFASWKSYKVEVSGNECNTCHRLSVNTVSDGGTALDFGVRATAASETSKNPPSAASPIWMPPVPVQVAFSQAHANSAKAIHDCALRFHEGSPLPSGPDCRITQFAGAFVPPVPPPDTDDITTINPELFAPDDTITIEVIQ